MRETINKTCHKCGHSYNCDKGSNCDINNICEYCYKEVADYYKWIGVD